MRVPFNCIWQRANDLFHWRKLLRSLKKWPVGISWESLTSSKCKETNKIKWYMGIYEYEVSSFWSKKENCTSCLGPYEKKKECQISWNKNFWKQKKIIDEHSWKTVSVESEETSTNYLVCKLTSTEFSEDCRLNTTSLEVFDSCRDCEGSI